MEKLIENDDLRQFDLLLASDKRTEIIAMRGAWCGGTLLHISVRHDKLEMAKRLVKAGVDVNCTDRSGHTCAHIASLFGSVTLLRYVCKHFPHLLNLQNKYRRTCLHSAVRNDDLPLVRVLLEHNVDIDVRDEGGETPFDVARRRNYRHLVEELKK